MTRYKFEILPKDPEYPTHTFIRMSFLEDYVAESLLRWVSQQDRGESHFPEHFNYTVTAHYESYVFIRSLLDSGIPRFTHFIIRIYDEDDLKWFLECWPYSPEEYEQEKKRLIELENRKNGTIVIDGKSYGISELAPIQKLPEVKKPAPRYISEKPEGARLVEFLKTMELDAKGNPHKGVYCVNHDPGYRDFSREIRVPSAEFPEGMVGIRVDDDFYIAAIIPYEFVALTCEEIVAILWPNIVAESFFHNDSDDKEYWKEYFQPMKDQREKWAKERKKKKKIHEKILNRSIDESKKKNKKIAKDRARWKKSVV